MHRGYIKFWRSAEDCASWTRGLVHRGMMVTILHRAAWKPRYEMGTRVGPGEFLIKVAVWAESLNMPQSSLRRVLRQLVEDGFISLANVANRYTRICVTNWQRYQQEEGASRRAGCEGAAAARPGGGGPAADPSYKEEEGKKTRRQEAIPPPPSRGRRGSLEKNMATGARVLAMREQRRQSGERAAG